MSVYIGNQKAKQLVYVDANGVQHNIKEAYLGSQLVYSAKKNGFTITAFLTGERPIAINGNTTYFTLEADVPTFIETGKLTSMYFFLGETNIKYIKSLDFSTLDTSKVTTMECAFANRDDITSLDLSNFDTSNVTSMRQMFSSGDSLTSLDLSNFVTSKVTASANMYEMFSGCSALTHIKCKQAFKDWCWANATTIKLPTAMKSGGSGTWEIVG